MIIQTNYRIVHKPNDYYFLCSDNRFYSGYICISGCNTLIYKKMGMAKKTLNKKVSKKLHPDCGLMKFDHYKDGTVKQSFIHNKDLK
jgi:hypothetical protein